MSLKLTNFVRFVRINYFVQVHGQSENKNIHNMGSGVVLCAMLLGVFVNRVIGSGEIHADEGGKFAAFKTQADFAEKELRKELSLKPDDEVHIASVALQVSDKMFRIRSQINFLCKQPNNE